jgi:hypothetical protein
MESDDVYSHAEFVLNDVHAWHSRYVDSCRMAEGGGVSLTRHMVAQRQMSGNVISGVRITAPSTVPTDRTVLEHGPLIFWVPGIPRPKGSLRPQVGRTGAVHMVEQSAGVGEWLDRVKLVASDAWSVRNVSPLASPVHVAMLALFVPSNGAERTSAGPMSPTIGDTDKVERGIGDALVRAGVLKDDRFIVSWAAAKEWAPEGCSPGAWVSVGVHRGRRG